VADDKPNNYRIPILTSSALWKLPPPDPLIEGIISQGEVTGLFGPSNIGKTFLLLSWLLCLCTGLWWCGRRVVRTNVLYITDEGKRGIPMRERAWCKAHELMLKHNGISVPPEFPHGLGMLNLIKKEEMLHDLREFDAQGIKFGLIAIDTFGSAIATGDEVKDMPAAMSNARLLADTTGAAVLLNHHPTKEGKYERGGGQFRNKVDVLLECLEVKDAPKLRCLHFEKMRDDEKVPDLMFGLEKFEFDSPWGRRSSLAVTGLKNELDLPVASLGKLFQTAWEVHAEEFPEGAAWTDWYKATAKRMGQTKKGNELDRKAFSGAVKDLVTRKYIHDAADGVIPRPKGALYLLMVQPEKREGRKGETETGIGVGGGGDLKVPTLHPPIRDPVGAPIPPISTDPPIKSAVQSKVAETEGQLAPQCKDEGAQPSYSAEELERYRAMAEYENQMSREAVGTDNLTRQAMEQLRKRKG
jgi:hypothetical protein